LILDSGAAGAGECQVAFEKWSKLSQSRVRMQNFATSSALPAVGDKRPPSQACAPGDGARQELLRALTRVRAKCDELPSDPVAPATKTMIDINEGFIRALPLCREEAAAVTKAAPAPPPTAVPAAAAGPAVAAAPAPSALAQPEGSLRRCLQVLRVAPERYTLSNRWCGGSTVLAIVETRGASGEVECKAHAIGQSMTVRSLSNSPPQVNHECLWSQGNCTKDHLDGMFPECDW
jgi:hypothetical protein